MISTTDPSQVPVNKNVSTTTLITKEIESRIKKSPDYVFEVFLEIREPANENDQPEILLKYPLDFVDDMLKSVANFVYPCKISLGEQDEHYAFAVLDNTAVLFRFGYCRRSNRESTCLCILSYYPWFETFYTILNDISQIINYRTHNFAMMYSCLGSDLMLQVFSHILFERRMLFVSSKLFHLTTCACGCLQLIFPMHWQSIFVPILPSSMTWLCQCTVPYIIGIHTNIFSTLTISELGDIVIVNIDERTIETQYDDLSRLPKHLYRGMKKGIQRSEKLPGDSLAKVFLRAMAFTVGSYSNGFIFKDDKLDFDRDQYLRQYENTPIHEYMSAVSHTQMFEQFSRYRTDSLITSFDDEFDLEVKNVQQIQQSKKIKANKKFHRILEKANPIIEQVQNRAEKLGTVINRAGQRVIIEASTINDVIKRNEYRMKDDNVVSTTIMYFSLSKGLHCHFKY
ncbi:unnamed protein product [Didymodactylos carnosus]|uniref:UDENN domain-containing protein n=1 Tax=Didymodactylos carnosus TaxID=1234261 RepID=A0A8S2HE22_9BILA|nr:unnamed protein product [Didymodactylos carnosus]CAF3629474.1 unnamed protein product [Didymodactylos carnosus]